MYELNLDIANVLSSLYTDILEYELPLEFDFTKNKVGVYYTINNIADEHYKGVATLDINFYCLQSNKVEMLKLLNTIDKQLNKKSFKEYWITHKNVYLISLKEDDKLHYILSYNVNNY